MKQTRRQILFFITLFGLVLLSSCKQEVFHTFYVGPYVQNVSMEGINISWEDDVVGEGIVYYGETEKLGNNISDNKSAKLHEVILTGLEVESKYFYQVESAGKKSEIFHFNTAVEKDSPFSFAVYGDNKDGPFNHEKVANLISVSDPDFVLHIGDLVSRGRVHKQWEKLFFTPARNMISHIPIFTIQGNHEDNDPNYYNYFTPPSDNKGWYSYDYGNAHFIILSSDVLLDDSTQVNWLINDLKENQHQTWRFVLLHHPPFSSGGQYYSDKRIKIKDLVVPVFNEYNVDMVLNGHDHHYERSLPIIGENANMPVTYIVCGNGGTPMRYVIPSNFTKVAKRVFGFTSIEIDGSVIHYKHTMLNGELLDEFVLDKNDPASVDSYKEGMLVYETMHDVALDVAIALDEADDLFEDDELYEEAIAKFKWVFKEDPNCWIAKGFMANCYVALGEFDKAKALALETYEKIPQFDDTYEALIDMYIELENWEEALLWIDRLEEVTADSPDAAGYRSEIFEKMNDLPKAIEALMAGISIVPNDAELHFDLADLYGDFGDTTLMLQSLRNGADWFYAPEDDEDYVDYLEVLERIKMLENN